MIKKSTPKILLFLTALLIISVCILDFSVEKVKGKGFYPKTKRGYIFDRNFEPIVISSENYKAYYLIKDGIGSADIPPVVRKYIGSVLNLPKKGLIFISDNLSLDELNQLKKEKNVIIEKSFKRKLLEPYLKFLIGETFNGYGVSGLEKVFDDILQKGKPVTLSIDLRLEKKLYNLSRPFEEYNFAAALFDLRTGEVLAYIENSKAGLFNLYYPVSIFGITKRHLPDFKWTLGDENVIRVNNEEKINLWYLSKLYMDTICKIPMTLTLLYTKKQICNLEPNFLERKKNTYFFNKGFINVYFKNSKMMVVVLISPSKIKAEEFYTLNKKLDNLVNLSL